MKFSTYVESLEWAARRKEEVVKEREQEKEERERLDRELGIEPVKKYKTKDDVVHDEGYADSIELEA